MSRLRPVVLIVLFLCSGGLQAADGRAEARRYTYAADVFVPPVLKGVKGEGKARTPRPVPLPAADEEWNLVRSRNFIFISSADERRTREVAEDLETLAAALSQLNPQFKAEAPIPTRVILFSRGREAQPYFDLLVDRDNANLTGVYVAQKQGGSILMHYGFGSRYENTAFHELVHNLIANSGATLPLWLDEGLAEYFSNADINKRVIRAGGPVKIHLDALKRPNLIPLDKLFDVVRESDTYNLPSGQRTFYAESWAIVDWLMRESGKDQGKFFAFLRDIAQEEPIETALRTRYNKKVADVQRALETYGGFRTNYAVSIPVPNVDTSTTTNHLTRSDVLYELGSFLAGLEISRPEAERHFRSALDADPRHARSMAALGGLRAADAKHDEAEKFFDQAIAADPNDASIHLAFAEALLQTQIGALAESTLPRDEDIPRFRKARSLAARAIALGTTEQARAYGDLGTTYIVENDAELKAGIDALQKARALAPGRLDYAIHLFALYRRVGDRAKADPLFTILEAARNPQVSYAAKAVMMRVELARANDFLKDNKLNEAADVIRSLATATADLDARADLERQANDIAHVAEQNRQIEVYNRAVGQVTTGDYRGALKTLNELLASATDPSVIRDAKKLQKKLAARFKS